jgi:hypothetical protein
MLLTPFRMLARDVCVADPGSMTLEKDSKCQFLLSGLLKEPFDALSRLNGLF